MIGKYIMFYMVVDIICNRFKIAERHGKYNELSTTYLPYGTRSICGNYYKYMYRHIYVREKSGKRKYLLYDL